MKKGYDEKCQRLIYLFNRLGLQTKFSCQGHEPGEKYEIMFHETVDSKKIIKLLKFFDKKDYSPTGRFAKWLRYFNDMKLDNWIYTIQGNSSEAYVRDEYFLDIHFEELLKELR